MKAAIHPETRIASVTCSSCGATFVARSTRPSLEVDICSACHPAYTGSRVERFERRRAAARS